jgi:hypothetical protein
MKIINDLRSAEMAIRFNNVDELKRLIEVEGVDVNAVITPIQDTLLHEAAFAGQKEMVEFLISKGANLNVKNRQGETPLHKAAQHGYIEILKLLLHAGANYLEKDRFGHTPQQLASDVRKCEAAKFLIDYVKTFSHGRNLATFQSGLTKGTKNNAAAGLGLSNMPSEVINRIGSFFSGKKGTLRNQRGKLRSIVGHRNAAAPAGGAGVAPAGGAGAAAANKGGARRRTRRHTRKHR